MPWEGEDQKTHLDTASGSRCTHTRGPHCSKTEKLHTLLGELMWLKGIQMGSGSRVRLGSQ